MTEKSYPAVFIPPRNESLIVARQTNKIMERILATFILGDLVDSGLPVGILCLHVPDLYSFNN